ncbi:uncharacterized protein C20orf96 homolog isoform X2 [Pseudorasbora parva]|uniref:uncharacterized protein C20orf96 homolog isoform X2 n=1 Tax=Pseudorasbora parva TaxID=51549 RepID=UPI00351E2677
MSRQEMMLNFHPVDYREWERSTRPKPVLWATLHHKTVRIRTSPTGKSGKSQNAVQNGFTTLPKLSTRRASEKVEQGQITSERKDNIKVLMLLIKSRKEAIKDLEEHCEQLQERNLQIARSIKNTDRHSVSGAKELLIQNDQMWRSMVALKKWDGSLIKCAKAELTDTEEMSHTHLNGLQKQLDMVKAEVVKAQKELRFLRTYKDMEFPVKALQIADMKRKLDRLKQMQQEEQEDVNQLFEKEMVRLERFQRQREQEVMSAVLEVIMELEQKNEELMKSIQELQLSRPNIRREIFPDVFLKSDKCTPDMDVHLNIPQEDLLPV